MQRPVTSSIGLYGVTLSILCLGGLLIVQTQLPKNDAAATETPPPTGPTHYTLTVRTEGGDSTCFVRISQPEFSDWTSGSVSDSFEAFSVYEVETLVVCPSSYTFSHWESEQDSELNGHDDSHAFPELELDENTTATAVFVPRILPDAESTEWYEHFSTSPHRGDVYWHKVSLSSNASQSFAHLSINEDFLPTEMDTSNCSMSLSASQKLTFQNNWDGSWDIDANNYREELNGGVPDDKYDAHGFNPYASPWNQMLAGETFSMTQRMRVEGCVSVNNEGPWFATHSILFKVITNGQSGLKEVFVKKSGVQGNGDPSI